jgi:integrase
MRQAELSEMRTQGSNPCRGLRRHRMPPRKRFLWTGELRRLVFVLDHAEDRQAAAAVRLLLFTGARPSEITKIW